MSWDTEAENYEEHGKAAGEAIRGAGSALFPHKYAVFHDGFTVSAKAVGKADPRGDERTCKLQVNLLQPR